MFTLLFSFLSQIENDAQDELKLKNQELLSLLKEKENLVKVNNRQLSIFNLGENVCEPSRTLPPIYIVYI